MKKIRTMDTYKAIIIEDELNAATLLETLLKDTSPNVAVLEKCIDLPIGVRAIKRYNPDIVFLDIELPMYNGTQLLEFFNTEEVTFQIIFTTAYDHYAIRAFEMNAIDYLMKPLQLEKLQRAIAKVKSRKAVFDLERLITLKQTFQTGVIEKMVLPTAEGYNVIHINSIYYMKAEGSYTKVLFCGNRSILVSRNLKHFESVLEGMSYFIRIHRSYIINLNFLKKVTYKNGGVLLLDNDIELPIAGDKIDKVLKLLHKA